VNVPSESEGSIDSEDDMASNSFSSSANTAPSTSEQFPRKKQLRLVHNRPHGASNRRSKKRPKSTIARIAYYPALKVRMQLSW
jgi:hypothetical protein